jgi:DNA repair exonuclease SbcCD nuclease subunit
VELDETNAWLNEEVAELMRLEIVKKKELAVITAQLKDTKAKLKTHMQKENIKTIRNQGLKITYTPPREYRDFRDKKMAVNYIGEIRPDMIQTKKGYERLTISLTDV